MSIIAIVDTIIVSPHYRQAPMIFIAASRRPTPEGYAQRKAEMMDEHVDPQAYLTEIIARIVNEHPNSRLDELMPWNNAGPAAPVG